MSFFGKSNQALFVILNIILVTACTGGSSKESCDSCEVPVDDTLFISSEYGNSESMSRNMSAVRFVILHEDDQTMFSDMNQLIDAFGKYFVVDSYSSRRVVSFDHDGKPFASYGRRGNGPGEYALPWNVDVSAEYVYIQDISQRKLIKYDHQGVFIDSKEIPFESKGFTLLKDGKILFKLEPSKETNYQLCVTDSMLTPLKYMLHYPDGYVGGWVTNNAFQKNKNGISYYCSPADTIYRLDYDGNLTGKRLLKFENGPIHESARINFIAAEEKGLITGGMHLLDNPVELSDGTCLMEVTDYTNEGTYTITLNPADGIRKVLKFADNMSVYDVIMPYKSDQENQVISYLDQMIAGKCYDFKILPDSLVKALDEGNRLLVIHEMK